MPATLVLSLLRRTLVPPTSAGRRLAFIALIDSLGTGLFLTGASLYFTRVVGLRPEQVGVGLSLAGVAGFLGSIPIGILADRFGAGRAYVALQLWRGFGYLAYGLISAFPAFVIVASAIGLADAAIPAINQAVVGDAIPDEHRVDTLAKIRALRNVGFGAGAALAAWAISAGSRAAFLTLVLGNASSFFIAAAMLSRAGLVRATTRERFPRRPVGVVHDARYIAAALVNGLLSVHLTLLTVGLPLWIAGYTKVPVVVIGVLVVINTIMAATLQAGFAASAKSVAGALVCARRAGFALAACALLIVLMAQAGTVWVGVVFAVAAVVAMTFGELWQSASGWTIAFAWLVRWSGELSTSPRLGWGRRFNRSSGHG